MSLFSLVLILFLMANPIGNAPACLALVKDFDFERQKKILLRESIFSLFIVYFFLFCGEAFLNSLQIAQYTVSISGGILLFLVSLYMIFPHTSSSSSAKVQREPFIVPIATPLIAGGGIFTTVIVYLKQIQDYWLMSEAIAIAWIFVIGFTYCSAYLQKIIGKSGLLALEQLMGMIIMMLSTELMVRGILQLLQTIQTT